MDKVFDKKCDDDIHANMRLIDMKRRAKNGSPYVWQMKDLYEIKDSDCLFSRKFDERIDGELISQVVLLCI